MVCGALIRAESVTEFSFWGLLRYAPGFLMTSLRDCRPSEARPMPTDLYGDGTFTLGSATDRSAAPVPPRNEVTVFLDEPDGTTVSVASAITG